MKRRFSACGLLQLEPSGEPQIDIKTTKETKPGRPELWQLVAYTLADWDDSYALSEVGFYYSRQGVTLRWPIDGFLRALAEKAVDLERERAEFRELLGGFDHGEDSLSRRA